MSKNKDFVRIELTRNAVLESNVSADGIESAFLARGVKDSQIIQVLVPVTALIVRGMGAYDIGDWLFVTVSEHDKKSHVYIAQDIKP